MRKLVDIVGKLSKEELIRSEEDRFTNQLKSVIKEIDDQCLHIVLLSGPSGSGKTTTSLRLKDLLEAEGRRTLIFSMDNWYKSRDSEDIPRDDKGNIDYESPNCIDLPLLNSHIHQLMEGKEVNIPHFDFINQKMTYNGNKCKLNSKSDIVIIEGIHALNSCIKVADGIRVFINPSDLEVNTNEILTGSELRLLRRIVRDEKYRGMTPEATIKKWESVTRGEKLYIEPNKKNVDIEIDSLIAYEVFIHDIHSVFDYSYGVKVNNITEKDIPKGSILEEFYR